VISPRKFRRIAPCVAAVAGALSVAPAAQADPVSISTCNSNTLSQIFAPWGDPSNYELAPGGDFEAGSAAWALSNGAAIVNGSEPFAVTGSLGGSALSLPAGASAISPATCVTAAYPDLRFFVAGSGIVQVSVIYGNTVIPAGTVPSGGSWAPGAIAVTGSAIAAAASGGTAQVSIELTAINGNPQVDDVYIDPWRSGG
jgi:hypothetical protein